MRRSTLALLLALGVIAPLAAQSVVQPTISGNEVLLTQQGPGGTGNFIGINTISNRRLFTTVSGTGAVTTTLKGGTTMWVGAAPTTWAGVLPSPVAEGIEVKLTTDTTLTSMVTVTPGGSDSIHAAYSAQTLTALTPVVFQYHVSDTTWYRTQ
jgi:hypothetical protein